MLRSSHCGMGLRVRARRAIHSHAARCGPVEEYLITNVAGPTRG